MKTKEPWTLGRVGGALAAVVLAMWAALSVYLIAVGLTNSDNGYDPCSGERALSNACDGYDDFEPRGP